jgi:hypothetical protein
VSARKSLARMSRQKVVSSITRRRIYRGINCSQALGTMAMQTFWIAASAATLLASAALPLRAQSMIPVKAGLVSYAEGKAYIDDRPIEVSATHFSDVKENTVVRTEAGRAEVLMGPCAVMWIGDNTSFRMITSRLIDTRIELLTGSAVVEAGAMSKDTKLTLVVKAADVRVDRKGWYRFDMQPLQVKVRAGKVAIEWANEDISVAAGQLLALDGAPDVRKLDKEKPDSMDDWSRSRAAFLVRASDLDRQEARREESLQSADARDVNNSGIGWSGPVGIKARVPVPSPLPGGSQSGAPTSSRMCGGGW